MRDAAEVHGDGGGRLARGVGEVVDARRDLGDGRLGGQRLDLGDRTPTVVVLPTPKPPAMTILTGSGGRATVCGSTAGRGSVGVTISSPGSRGWPETIDNPSQYGDVVGDLGPGHVHRQVTGGTQVLGEHPDHVQVQPQPGRELRERLRHAGRPVDDVVLLEGQSRPVTASPSAVATTWVSTGIGVRTGGARDPARGEQERPHRAGRARPDRQPACTASSSARVSSAVMSARSPPRSSDRSPSGVLQLPVTSCGLSAAPARLAKSGHLVGDVAELGLLGGDHAEHGAAADRGDQDMARPPGR